MEALDRTRVDEVMSVDVVACSPEAPLGELARRMVADEMHRVVVLDDDRKVLGIVSAFDFVRLAADG